MSLKKDLLELGYDVDKEEDEFLYIIYRYDYYKDSAWTPADPCELFGFTKPVISKQKKGFTEEEVENEWKKAPANCDVVGSGHSHYNEKTMSETDIETAKIYALRLGRNFHVYAVTPSNKLHVCDVWTAFNPATGKVEITGAPTYVFTHFDPSKPPTPWVLPE